jgi:pyruvate dehydrogenase E2 component (dihydrolipoamide acetyltransferase)
MAEVTMPRLSDTMEEGTIAEWLKKEGDKVEKGDVLLEIETDKATMSQESYEAGVLEKILVQAGQTVPIGTAIAIIGDGSGKAAAPTAPANAVPVSTSSAPTTEVPAPPAPATTTVAQPQPVAATTPGTNGERVLASPMARRIATEFGIPLERVKGSGPGGRIIKDDVLEAVKVSQEQAATATPVAQPAPAAPAAPAPVAAPQAAPTPVAAAPAPAPATSAPTAAPGADYEDIELNRMRQTIVRRMTESKQQVPHIYLTMEVNMTEALKWRQTINASLERRGGQKASVNDLVVKAVAIALRQFPVINSGFVDNKIRRYKRVHVAIAVALEDGLLTPVVRDADQKTLGQIAQETRQLAERARTNKLAPIDYQGGTFTISNLGMYGIENFQAVINQPQAAILAVGASEPKVIVKGESAEGQPQFEVIQAMKVTLSLDHRVADGSVGAQFLQELKRLLQDPMQLLV